MTDIDVIYQEETHIIYLHPVSTLYNGAISGSGTTDPSGSPEKKTWIGNQENTIGNQENTIGHQESKIGNQENTRED
jgi:hypothetical protein